MVKRLPLLLAASIGCGGKGGDAPAQGKPDGSAARTALPPLVMPALGVDSVTRFAYSHGPGQAEYRVAVNHYKERPDWPAIRTACEQAVAKDPSHLDAHWLLAGALAQAGDLAGAVEHAEIALAADDLRFGAVLDTPDLAPLMSSPYGKMVADLHARIAAAYAHVAETGLWVVAREDTFRVAFRDVHSQPPHGEVYVYDLASRRYIRISHTGNAVAGFVRGPGNELALLGFERVDRPRDDALAPLIASSWVLVIGSDGKPFSKTGAVLPSARQVSLGYDASGQLIAATAQAAGRWGVTEPTLVSVDKQAGKTTPIAGAALPGNRIAITVEDGQVFREPDAAVHATWAGSATAQLEVAGDAIAIPESAQTSAATVAVAHDRGHVAFATAVDPCARNATPSLYVADTKAKALHHVLTTASRFDLRWYDDATLAYEDGGATIRLWSTATGHEVGHLDDRFGIALDVLSPVPSPLCTIDGAAAIELGTGSGSAATPGAGSGEAMPPEDPPAPPAP